MRNLLAIARKELYSLFSGFIAYVVLAVFFLVSGYFFFLITTTIITQVMEAMFRSQQFGGPLPPMDVTALISRNYFGILSTILLFLVPMITMGVFAEEKKRGTIELLFTSPIRAAELILGKFLAVLVILGIMLLPTIFYMGMLYFYSDPRPPLAPIFTGYLGAVLMGAALLALGVFVSSLTENQIVAAVLTWGVFIILWVLEPAAGTSSTWLNESLRYVSILNHYDDFSRGIIDTQHVVFYLSFIFLGLYLTSVSLNSLKWRQ